jgi:hypothetical protein
MKPLLGLLAVTLLGVGSTACGGAHENTGTMPPSPSGAIATGGGSGKTAPSVSPPEPDIKRDHDDDSDSHSNHSYDMDDHSVQYYGHAASQADRRLVTAVVMRYYAAAAADDGTRGCSLIDVSLAKGLSEEYNQASSPAYLRSKTCAGVMSKLFKYKPERSSADLAAIRVTGVRVKDDSGLALLRLPTAEVREISVERERGAWKVSMFSDTTLP